MYKFTKEELKEILEEYYNVKRTILYLQQKQFIEDKINEIPKFVDNYNEKLKFFRINIEYVKKYDMYKFIIELPQNPE